MSNVQPPQIDSKYEPVPSKYEPVPVVFQTPIKTGFLLGLGIALAAFTFKLVGTVLATGVMLAFSYFFN